MNGSDVPWTAKVALVAPGCGTWMLTSPGSNLNSLPCSPYAHQADTSSYDNAVDYQLAFNASARAKRARVTSPVQAYGQAPRGGPFVSIETPSARRAALSTLLPFAVGWASSTSCVPRSVSGHSVRPVSAASIAYGAAPADSSQGVRGVFVAETVDTARQTFATCARCDSLGHSHNPFMQRCLSNECDCRVIEWDAAYFQCPRSSHASQPSCQPPALASQQSSNIPTNWAPAAGTNACTTGQLVLPFLFTGTAAPTQPDLQPTAGPPLPCLMGTSACAAVEAFACNLPQNQYCSAGGGLYGLALGHGTFLQGVVAQLQQPGQQPLPLMRLGCPIAPSLRAARCAIDPPALGLLQHQQQRQALLQLQHQQQQQALLQQQQPAQLGLPPSQLVRRVRPLSPTPHSPSSPPRSPESLGPEDWILHVVDVLGLSGADTPRLALHCWRRMCELPQLHHATRLWPTVAIGKNLYATACVWVSIKLEEKRRSAPGGVVLAHMAATTPGALCSAELAVMNWLAWRPYDGYRLDESHLLVYM